MEIVAPEIIDMTGASFSSDIWSLGCTIVELLTGLPPYASVKNSLSGELFATFYHRNHNSDMFSDVPDRGR